MSARVWSSGDRIVAGVPELGLNCYGATQSEAVFRLFTSLLKYYRQLKESESDLTPKGRQDLRLLKSWVASVEKKMALGPAVAMSGQAGVQPD